MFVALFIIDFILQKSYLKIFSFAVGIKKGLAAMINYWKK
jgi:hypothetical protein